MENPFSHTEGDGSDESFQQISYNEVAAKLLKDKLWLTALELHTELVEAGRELPRLREFFSNPVNFENQSRLDVLPTIPRSSSQATLDSLDMTRFSEDGERIADEKVAVLEFELRKAKETISALRANLTVATVEGTNSPKAVECDPIKPHEQRALNFLINEYLLMRNYRLTSITFSDENEDQDFEDWDDVGLNMSKPAQLLHLYRVGIKEIVHDTKTIETQTEFAPETQQTPPEIQKATKEIGVQSEEMPANRSDVSGSFEEINHTEIDAKIVYNDNIEIDIEDDISSDISFKKEETLSLISAEESPKMAKNSINIKREEIFEDKPVSGFEGEVWSHLPHLRVEEGPLSTDNLVASLGRSLSSILAELPDKREWLPKVVPILVCIIRLHPDEKTKDSLIHSLLNLKKRPNQEDRNLILSGIVRLTENVNDESLNSQILSQFSETMGQKYPEKRILIAQACAHISPFINSELRDSFLISMLKQLLEDRDEQVRAQSATSLAVIALQITTDKYSEIEELTLKCLSDRSENVVKVVQRVLLPVVARWSFRTNVLHTNLIPHLLKSLEKSVQNQEKDALSCNLIKGLIQILPYLVMYSASADTVVESIGPDTPPPQHRVGFTAVCKGLSDPSLFYDRYPLGAVIGAFDFCLQQLSPWPQLSWVIDFFIPKILEIVDLVLPEREDLIMSFVSLFKSLTAGYGTTFTTRHVKNIFLDKLTVIEKGLINMENDEFPPFSVIIVFCVGILASLQGGEIEIGQVLGRFLTSLGLCGAPLTSLHVTVRQLAKFIDHSEDDFESYSTMLMSALWQGVAHQRANVKKATSHLLADAISLCPQEIISARISPALITLASDPDISVRISTLPVYALILEHCQKKEILDKTYLQVRTIVEDPSTHQDPLIMSQIISSLTKIGIKSTSSFREETVFPELDRITKAGFDLKDPRRSDVAASLVESFSNLIFLEVSQNCINSTLLPTLRLLESFCKEVLTTNVATVTTMIKEIESRFSTPVTPSSSRSNLSLSSISSPNVEDMKQKVTKIFNSPKTPNLQNMTFWKK